MDKRDDDIWDRLRKKDNSNSAQPTNIKKPQQYKQSRPTAPNERQSSAIKAAHYKNKKDRSSGYLQNSKETKGRPSSKKPKDHQLKSFLSTLRQAQASKKNITIGSVAAVAIVGLVLGGVLLNRDTPETPQSLGVSSNGNQQIAAPELPDEDPSFELLYREPYTKEDYRIVRSSPEGNTPAYTFIDRVDQTEVRITQQQIAAIEGFSGVGEAAENFQATDVIQVDGENIYHGVNERSGVQSLITTKNGILILISSPRQLPDEVWVGYVTSLQ